MWKGRFSAGIKAAFVNTDNDFQFYNHDINNNQTKRFDSSQFNHFVYKERINAGYVSYAKNFKKVQFLIGLRVEETISNGKSSGYASRAGRFTGVDSSFRRELFDFFPSGSISYKVREKEQWVLAFSRRINRPSYGNLNPFERRQDEYTRFTGNPFLRPEYANNFTLTYAKKALITTIGYSRSTNAFVAVSDTVDKVNTQYVPRNLDVIENFSLSVNYSYSKNWFSILSNLLAYYSHNYGDLGKGRSIDLNVTGITFYVSGDFILGKGWTASLSSTYNSPTFYRGFMKQATMYSADLGLQKKVIKGKGTLRLSITDMTNSMHWKGTSDFAGQYIKAYAYWEPRQVKITFAYRFGSTKIKAARQRKTGLEDEKQRTSGS